MDDKPEEHFMSVLHVIAYDAETITDKLEYFFTTSGLEYSKMVGHLVKWCWSEYWSADKNVSALSSCTILSLCMPPATARQHQSS